MANTIDNPFINQSTSFPPYAVLLSAAAAADDDSRRDCHHSTNMNSEIRRVGDFEIDNIGSNFVDQEKNLAAHTDKEEGHDMSED